MKNGWKVTKKEEIDHKWSEILWNKGIQICWHYYMWYYIQLLSYSFQLQLRIVKYSCTESVTNFSVDEKKRAESVDWIENDVEKWKQLSNLWDVEKWKLIVKFVRFYTYWEFLDWTVLQGSIVAMTMVVVVVVKEVVVYQVVAWYQGYPS